VELEVIAGRASAQADAVGVLVELSADVVDAVVGDFDGAAVSADSMQGRTGDVVVVDGDVVVLVADGVVLRDVAEAVPLFRSQLATAALE